MHIFEQLLSAGDLRTIGKSKDVLALIDSQDKFDDLFKLLYHSDRKIVMRAADVIEKATMVNPSFLNDHKQSIIQFCKSAKYKEFKWHLAQLVERCKLTENELGEIWKILTYWVTDKKESRIVRVNSLQSLYGLAQGNKDLLADFLATVNHVRKENVPSLNARIRKLCLPHS